MTEPKSFLEVIDGGFCQYIKENLDGSKSYCEEKRLESKPYCEEHCRKCYKKKSNKKPEYFI